SFEAGHLAGHFAGTLVDRHNSCPGKTGSDVSRFRHEVSRQVSRSRPRSAPVCAPISVTAELVRSVIHGDRMVSSARYVQQSLRTKFVRMIVTTMRRSQEQSR